MTEAPADRPVPGWELRYRAARISLPDWARDAPDRSLYVSNRSGRFEVWAWDRAADTHRQVTDRPNGTADADIPPDGEAIWWFDDTDGDEFGSWMRQPFAGGADGPVAPSIGKAYSGGLALGRSLAVIGQQDASGSRIWLVPHDGGEPRLLYQHVEDAEVADLSYDEDLVAIAHSEHGDARHKALRVLALDGSTVGDLWDGPGLGLDGVGFAPLAGDRRLLALHERSGRPLPVLWDLADGSDRRVDVEEPGDVSADWYADGSSLLLAVEAEARSRLLRLDLVSGATTPLETPRGTVSAATARPDGTVEYSWSSAAEPSSVRALGGGVVLRAPGPAAPPSVPVEDAWVDGPGGRVHALVSRPSRGAAPYPTIVDVHGGPHAQDGDEFVADVGTYVDAGFCVLRVNYRGSTGYGAAWRDAIEGWPGLTEMEDVSAVRDWAVGSGLADPARLVLAGGSWGGYLTLLGLGTRPDDWSLGVAIVPVADYVAAYDDEMEGLQAFDRALFGGSPAELPDLYRECSPITYVDRVRVPVQVLAGENDPRCPIRQIENYLARLRSLGKRHEVYRFDAGHGTLVVEDRIRLMRAILDFLDRHVPR